MGDGRLSPRVRPAFCAPENGLQLRIRPRCAFEHQPAGSPRRVFSGLILLLGGFARIPLGTSRSHRTRWTYRTCGPRRTCRSRRSGRSRRSSRSSRSAVLYHHVFRIRPGGNLDDASGGEFRSNPGKPAIRSALDLHRFVGVDFDLHVRFARSPHPSDDRQVATRDGGSRDQYFCAGNFAPCDHTGDCGSKHDADKLCEHGKSPCNTSEC